MQQKALTEFIAEQLGTEASEVALTDYLSDEDFDELMDTGSVEIDLNEEITVLVTTSCEVVAKQPEDSSKTEF